MRRALLLGFTLALVLACGGKDTEDTGPEETDDPIVGDGQTPVILTGYYWCGADPNGNSFYFFSVEADDEQGTDTLDWGAKVWFMDGDDYLFGEDAPLTIICQNDTDPRYCEGSLLESEYTGACLDSPWTYQAEIKDVDGHVSERYTEFVVNPSPPA